VGAELIIQSSGLGCLDNPRELRNFLEAKRRKREPVRLQAHGSVAASCEITSRPQWKDLFRQLCQNNSFAQAAESVDYLDTAVRGFGADELPTPSEVVQNADKSLTIGWKERPPHALRVVLQISGDRVAWMVGGENGMRGDATREFHPDLCRALVVTRNVEVKHARQWRGKAK